MNYPLVSIITITYNRADLIHRCIESIQKQTYQNYEHIIVDGNSKDNTRDVVLGYKDAHIKYIKLPHNGASYQMKEGSKIAKGKYVTFLDDDDEYLPEKVEKQGEWKEARTFEMSEISRISICCILYSSSEKSEGSTVLSPFSFTTTSVVCKPNSAFASPLYT